MLSVFLLRFAYLNSDVPYLNHLLPIFNGSHRIVLDYGWITSMDWQSVSRTVRIVPLLDQEVCCRRSSIPRGLRRCSLFWKSMQNS